MAGRDLFVELRRRISFRDGHADVWPQFYDAELFGRVRDALAEPLAQRVSKIAGIKSRGFLLVAAVATHLEVGFVAIRKQSVLFPGPKFTESTREDYRGRAAAFADRRVDAILSRGNVGAARFVRLIVEDNWK